MLSSSSPQSWGQSVGPQPGSVGLNVNVWVNAPRHKARGFYETGPKHCFTAMSRYSTDCIPSLSMEQKFLVLRIRGFSQKTGAIPRRFLLLALKQGDYTGTIFLNFIQPVFLTLLDQNRDLLLER
jgi:hypothetical protein